MKFPQPDNNPVFKFVFVAELSITVRYPIVDASGILAVHKALNPVHPCIIFLRTDDATRHYKYAKSIRKACFSRSCVSFPPFFYLNILIHLPQELRAHRGGSCKHELQYYITITTTSTDKEGSLGNCISILCETCRTTNIPLYFRENCSICFKT